MSSSQRRSALLFGTAAVAGGLFAAISRQVQRRAVAPADAAAREEILEATDDDVARAADVTGHAGKWHVHLPLAVLGALALVRAGRLAGAATVVGSSLGAVLLAEVLDRAFDHRTPPPGRGDPSVQSYPSGHALEPTLVAIASGYVLVRERIAPVWATAPLALAALVSGLGRLALDRHWVSDVAGGYAVGIAAGCATAGAYELARGA